jgi:hypothetical protein
MMRFERPPEPADFAGTVGSIREKIRKNPNDPAVKFSPLWSGFKPLFSAAQNGRCGYCDGPTTGLQHGDVEHYAPKSEVAVLGVDEATWGEEAPNSSSVKGRRPQLLSDSGYWWLAYEWSNYLLSCQTCNQTWKGTIFPVREPPDRTIPPDELVREKALLLNPFDGPHPAKHLRFNDDGSVEPWKNSRHGRETIKTVGLDRPSIRMYRRGAVSDAREAIRELAEAKAAGDEAAQKRAVRDLVRLGQAERMYAGCVRAMAEQDLELSWEKIEEIASGA